MNRICSIILISIAISVLFVCADNKDGKYNPRRYHQNAGRYIPMKDHIYYHVDDMRHLGRYIHIPYPYMGGYGPYSGMNIPYIHQHDGNFYEHVSSSSEYHPYNVQGYDIQKPEIPLAYGFPNILPKFLAPRQLQSTSPLSSSQLQSLSENQPPINPDQPNFQQIYPTQSAIDTTTNNVVDNDSTTIITGESLRSKRSLFNDNFSQTPKAISSTTARPTEPTRPRTRYDDEGKWKIIRQEENKQQKQYDYFFETENGIFAQEAGKVTGKERSSEGTNGVGYYQYIGDDGKVYRVEYEVGEQGFVPKGDHIHKSIQTHLNSLKQRNLI